MDLIQVLQRSLSGYVFVVPGLFLYFLICNKSGKRQTPAHIASAFVFCYYLIGVLTMTGIGKIQEFSPRFSLIPFLDMIRGPLDTALNVLLFIPFGFFLSLMYKKYNRISGLMLTITEEMLIFLPHFRAVLLLQLEPACAGLQVD